MNHHGIRTWIEVDEAALRANAAWFERLARSSRLMAVIKSNAYGHGLSLTARILTTGAPKRWLGVDSIVEGLRLRKDGIRNPVLVFGYTLPERLPEAARRNLTVTISHFDSLRALAALRIRPSFHLKYDTGMHRQGFQAKDEASLIASLRKNRLHPTGVYSHVAFASNKTFTHLQAKRFQDSFSKLVDVLNARPIAHLAATGTTLGYPASRLDMVRIGLGLYGYVPNSEHAMLKPALSWKTIVGEVKSIQAGERIGYDLTKRFRRTTRIAILPIGYWHGYDRGLSNIGEVLLRGRRARITGRVCMDMTMADVTNIPGARVGDEVVLIGRQGRERIDASSIGLAIGTTAYEVLTRLNPLIRRIPV